MEIHINKEFCKGCGYCIEYFPRKVYELSDELNGKGYRVPRIAWPEDCSECGLCDSYCPEFAIILKKTA
jgi:2-oxoglutarate ferredoxin oxidoreductase subunit delta